MLLKVVYLIMTKCRALIDCHFLHLTAKLFKYVAKEKTFEHIFYDSQPKPAIGLDGV